MVYFCVGAFQQFFMTVAGRGVWAGKGSRAGTWDAVRAGCMPWIWGAGKLKTPFCCWDSTCTKKGPWAQLCTQAGHRGATKNTGVPACHCQTWGCPQLCWASRTLLAGAEAPQAIVRKFAKFFFFRLTAGDGKLCEGCGSTVS